MRARGRSTLGACIVAGVTLASGAVLAWLAPGIGWIAVALPTYLGGCDRLRDANLGPTDQDWFCSITEASVHGMVGRYALPFFFGLALACAILAWRGRRIGALLPLAPLLLTVVAAPVLEPFFDTDVMPDIAKAHETLAGILVLALVAAPSIAVMLVFHRPKPAKLVGRTWPLVWSAFVCAALGWGLIQIAGFALSDQSGLDLFGGDVINLGVSAGVVVAIFSGLLGTDRRWWPWSIVLVATFLSLGPSSFASGEVEPSFGVFTLPFLAVVPLTIAGVAASLWQSLGERITRKMDARKAPLRDVGDVDVTPRSHQGTDPVSRRRQLRPVVVLNALAIAIVICSLIAGQNDTLGIAIATSLPTYLGVRERAQDYRAQVQLRQAMDVADHYRSREGTYEGLKKMAPGDEAIFQWGGADEVIPRGIEGSAKVVVTSSDDTVSVAAVSEAGTGWCLQKIDGQAETMGQSKFTDERTAVKQAMSNCADSPATNFPRAAPPPLECRADQGDYVLCRMVEVLVHNILEGTPAAGYGEPG